MLCLHHLQIKMIDAELDNALGHALTLPKRLATGVGVIPWHMRILSIPF